MTCDDARMQQDPYRPPADLGPAPYPPYAEPRPNQELEFVAPYNVAPLALIAGYVGLASLLCLPSPLALGLGIAALRDLDKRPDRTGKGRAWFAIVMGGIGTAALLFGLVAGGLG